MTPWLLCEREWVTERWRSLCGRSLQMHLWLYRAASTLPVQWKHLCSGGKRNRKLVLVVSLVVAWGSICFQRVSSKEQSTPKRDVLVFQQGLEVLTSYPNMQFVSDHAMIIWLLFCISIPQYSTCGMKQLWRVVWRPLIWKTPSVYSLGRILWTMAVANVSH